MELTHVMESPSAGNFYTGIAIDRHGVALWAAGQPSNSSSFSVMEFPQVPPFPTEVALTAERDLFAIDRHEPVAPKSTPKKSRLWAAGQLPKTSSDSVTEFPRVPLFPTEVALSAEHGPFAIDRNEPITPKSTTKKSRSQPYPPKLQK